MACERVKPTIRNIVVFLNIYICTINLLLSFDNTTGMTHLKIMEVFAVVRSWCFVDSASIFERSLMGAI